MESGEVKTDSKENDLDVKVTTANGKFNKPDFDPSNISPGKNVKKRPVTSTLGDPQVPRRLSQLFNPPKADNIPLPDDETNESSRLLLTPSEERKTSLPNLLPKVANRSPQLLRNDGDNQKERIAVLDNIESQKEEESEFELDNESHKSSHSSTHSEDESDNNYNDKEPDYTSWDDTICSNRSAYFKHYYQKNLSAIGGGRQSEGATSHNSLVSLIKEKDKMSDKKSIEDRQKKKKEDLGLMFLVIFLFLILVVGISLIYHYYQIHLEELSLFKRLKFHEDERLLTLIDSNGHLDIQARLGTTLPVYSKPEDCTHYLQHFYNYKNSDDQLPKNQIIRANKSAIDFVVKRRRSQNEFQFDDETVCLDWANQARVQIHRSPSQENVNCYNVFWSAQVIGLSLQDCMLINSPEHGVWWGIGELTGGGFPLESITNIPSSPFKTGDLGKHPFGRILRRTSLSSFGGLLILPDHLPASISVNPDELCVSVNATRDGLDPSVPLTLNYTICSSPNASSTLDYLHYLARGGKLFQLSIKEQEILRDRILQRIEYPMWLPFTTQDQDKLTQDSILEYVENIVQTNQSEWGHILLPLSWQAKVGDLKFDPVRFPDPKNLTESLIRKGFRLALTISPLVSTDTKAFSNGTTEGFWVQQFGSSLPALVSHEKFLAGAYTDFTNPRASTWFVSMLSEIKDDTGIDLFHLNPPDAHSIPRYHEFNRPISNADLALQPFLKAVSKINLPLSTEAILSPPPLPTFVSISNEDSGWKALESLVPRILTLSMLGFPLVDAGVIGGDIALSGHLVDSKLFIRWFQAVSFLPAFQMSVLPDGYDEETLSIIEEFRMKRKTLVLPRLQKAVEGTLVNNTPLIYPLGLLYPEDLLAAAVGDEWILGDDLLVAPILEKDKTSRNIYIPSGLWESQLDSRLKKGPGWIYDYKVPLSDVALFIKRYTMK
ncbi:putative family 31 glucosidase [Armadillidium vulgare]|nr:putative family 31 glucosidase [Armadillidium vulgare]